MPWRPERMEYSLATSCAWAVALLLLWLATSAILYAHLVVAQLYVMAERVARYA